MEVIDLLTSCSKGQLIEIAKERGKIPYDSLNAFAQATVKARLAARQFNPDTWTTLVNAYANAVIYAIRRVDLKNPFQTNSILSAVENLACGILGHDGLTFVEYNLCVGPVATVIAPELFAEKQGWEIIPIVNIPHRVPYHSVAVSKTPSKRRESKPRDTTSDDILAILAGAALPKEEAPDISTDPDIAKMLAAMTGQQVVEDNTEASAAEREGVIISESGETFDVLSATTGIVVEAGFSTEIEAIIFVGGKGWKIK